MLIRNATIYTAVAPEPFVGDVRVCNGKILAVGRAGRGRHGAEPLPRLC